jgi:hypothetical protein
MLSLQLETPIQVSPFGFPVAPLVQQGCPTLVPAPAQSWKLANFIQLNFSELRPFEVVHHQYQQWGIEFEQAIALLPSNPAFTDIHHPVGLMPIAHPYMAIRFHQPRQVIKAKLVGARAILITAFDAENRVVARYDLERCSTPNLNWTAPNTTKAAFEPALPLHALHLQAKAITRIELTSATPFVLQCFCCI